MDNTTWRATGSRAAGRRLLEALGSDDEDLRTIAGMFIVRGGRKAVPLLEEAIKKREHLPIVLTIAADVGATEFEPELRELERDSDPNVARAAHDALQVLSANKPDA